MRSPLSAEAMGFRWVFTFKRRHGPLPLKRRGLFLASSGRNHRLHDGSPGRNVYCRVVVGEISESTPDTPENGLSWTIGGIDMAINRTHLRGISWVNRDHRYTGPFRLVFYLGSQIIERPVCVSCGIICCHKDRQNTMDRPARVMGQREGRFSSMEFTHIQRARAHNVCTSGHLEAEGEEGS